MILLMIIVDTLKHYVFQYTKGFAWNISYNFQNNHVKYDIIPISQIKKLRLWEVK